MNHPFLHKFFNIIINKYVIFFLSHFLNFWIILLLNALACDTYYNRLSLLYVMRSPSFLITVQIFLETRVNCWRRHFFANVCFNFEQYPVFPFANTNCLLACAWNVAHGHKNCGMRTMRVLFFWWNPGRKVECLWPSPHSGEISPPLCFYYR